MPSLTLKGVPDDLMKRLRARAKTERRSLNQQVIRQLEESLPEPRPDFMTLHKRFTEEHGPSPFDEETHAAAFSNLRDRSDFGRPSPFADEEE